jgi:fructose-1,6-bisphosphatase
MRKYSKALWRRPHKHTRAMLRACRKMLVALYAAHGAFTILVTTLDDTARAIRQLYHWHMTPDGVQVELRRTEAC